MKGQESLRGKSWLVTVKDVVGPYVVRLCNAVLMLFSFSLSSSVNCFFPRRDEQSRGWLLLVAAIVLLVAYSILSDVRDRVLARGGPQDTGISEVLTVTKFVISSIALIIGLGLFAFGLGG